MHSYTLVLGTIAFSVGVALGLIAPADEPTSLGWFPRLVPLALAFVLALALASPRVLDAALCALCFALGTWRVGTLPPTDDVDRVASLPTEAIFMVDVLEGARPGADGASVQANVLAIVDPHPPAYEIWDVSGTHARVRIVGIHASRTPISGDRLLVRARVVQSGGALHPFAFDAQTYARVRNIDATLVAVGEPIYAQHKWTWRRPLDRLRLRVEHLLMEGLDDPVRGIAVAMITGSRADLDREIRQRFATTGVAHVLAVSGLHLGLLCWATFTLLKFVIRRVWWITRRWYASTVAAWINIPLVVAYVVFTGAPASAMRAGVMAIALLIALGRERASSSVHALSAACMGLLVWQPLWVMDAGFQLSVSATAALVTFALAERRWRDTRRRGQRWSWFWDNAVCTGLRASLAASVGTTPVLLWHFGEFPVLSAITNLLVVPPLTLIMLPLAVLATALNLVGLSGSGWCFGVATRAATLSLELSAWTAPVLATSLVWGRPGLLGLVGWSIHAGSAPFWGPSRWRLCALMQCVALLALMGDLPPWLRLRATLEVHAIPVGQGDCTLVLLPDRRALLIDAGGFAPDGGEVGPRRVIPYLRGMGIGAVDVVVVSHGHIDHYGGLIGVAHRLRPQEVWYGAEPTSPIYAATLDEYVARGARLRPFSVGSTTIDSGTNRMEVHVSAIGDANEDSLVLRICVPTGARDAPEICVLLAGDIEREREAQFAEASTPLRATYLKLPHHGSGTSSSAAFLDAVRPQVAVTHLGANNRFGFPSATVTDRLEDRGVRVGRTDQGCAPVFGVTRGQWWYEERCARWRWRR